MAALDPVLVDVRASDGVVCVRDLIETHVGLALVDGEGYRRIGQVQPFEQRDGYGVLVKKTWRWFYDEFEWGHAWGDERSRSAAVDALIHHAGYYQARPNAANQGIF